MALSIASRELIPTIPPATTSLLPSTPTPGYDSLALTRFPRTTHLGLSRASCRSSTELMGYRCGKEGLTKLRCCVKRNSQFHLVAEVHSPRNHDDGFSPLDEKK